MCIFMVFAFFIKLIAAFDGWTFHILLVSLFECADSEIMFLKELSQFPINFVRPKGVAASELSVFSV